MKDFDKIITQCNYLLNNHPIANSAKLYLNSRLSEEIQNLFSFGYFPNGSNIELLSSYTGEEILLKNNLIYEKNIANTANIKNIKISFFENHTLILPYKDVYGNIVSIVGRSLLNDDKRKENMISKYKNTSFKKRNHVFGLFEAKKHILNKNFVYIVEGQFDVIKAFEKGINNIVALGNSNMTGYQLSLILRYTNNLILLLDNDEAGEIGRSRIMQKFSKYADIKNIYLPQGYKDIDEYLNQNDANSLTFIGKNVKYNI